MAKIKTISRWDQYLAAIKEHGTTQNPLVRAGLAQRASGLAGSIHCNRLHETWAIRAQEDLEAHRAYLAVLDFSVEAEDLDPAIPVPATSSRRGRGQRAH